MLHYIYHTFGFIHKSTLANASQYFYPSLMIVKKILHEYGSLISDISTNNETLQTILKNTNQKDTIYALSLLIQKRYVNPTKIKNTVYYILNIKNIKRRLYFSLYLQFVEKKYGRAYSDNMYKILINGHYKVVDKETMSKMVSYRLAKYRGETKKIDFPTQKNPPKRSKKNDNKIIVDEIEKTQPETDFIMANYEEIDRKMFMSYFIEYIETVYDRNAKLIFTSMIDCIPISVKNLSNILSASLGKDTSLIIEKYICLLKGSKIVEDDYAKDTYRLNNDRIVFLLKQYVINKYLEHIYDVKTIRIYNLLVEKHFIDDKEIVRFGLLDDKIMKQKLIDLYKMGLIQINCVKNNKNGMIWEFDFGKACSMLANAIEIKIANLMDKLQVDWSVVNVREILDSDNSLYLNDTLLLSKMHFILTYDGHIKIINK